MAYSEEQTSEALAVLSSNGGNIARTRHELESAGWETIPAHKTLKRWREREAGPTNQREDEIGQSAAHKKEELAERLEELVRALLDDMHDPDRRAEASYRDLVGAFKTAVEKLLLLRKEATSIEESRRVGGPVSPSEQTLQLVQQKIENSFEQHTHE